MALITVQITTRTPEQVKGPMIYRLGKDYNVVTNIRRAQITDDYGFAVVDIEGSLEEVQRAVAWLMTTGMNIQTGERSVGKETVNL